MTEINQKGKMIKMDQRGDLSDVAKDIEERRNAKGHGDEELAKSHEELAKSYVEDSSEDDHEHHGPHGHHHKHTKQVINRLARAGGHLDKVKRMLENGEDCTDVLIQLSAVIAALNRAGKIILDDHIQNCIVDAVHVGDEKAIEDLKVAIDRFIK